MQMIPTLTQFVTIDTTGDLYSLFQLTGDYTILTFNDITADVQTGLVADVNNTQIFFTNNTTPIENKIKVDADGYYLKDVPAYDDNAAAITAGLTAGYIFKTTGSGAITTSGVLCIVE